MVGLHLMTILYGWSALHPAILCIETSLFVII